MPTTAKLHITGQAIEAELAAIEAADGHDGNVVESGGSLAAIKDAGSGGGGSGEGLNQCHSSDGASFHILNIDFVNYSEHASFQLIDLEVNLIF